MFLARLLVGEYTEGSPSYVRPPRKDKRGICLFDSCVDNVANPSIYVIFERQQIYPEYLLQYKLPKTGPCAAPVVVGGGVAAAAATASGSATATVVRAKKAKSTQQSNQNTTATSQFGSTAHKGSTPQQSPLQPCVIA